jgi:hypothetical protein
VEDLLAVLPQSTVGNPAAEVINAAAGRPPDRAKMMEIFRRHGMMLAVPRLLRRGLCMPGVESGAVLAVISEMSAKNSFQSGGGTRISLTNEGAEILEARGLGLRVRRDDSGSNSKIGRAGFPALVSAGAEQRVPAESRGQFILRPGRRRSRKVTKIYLSTQP